LLRGRKMKKYPPIKTIRSLLDYDPDTGIFRWKVTGTGRKVSQIAGGINNEGYLKIGINYRIYFAHRLAWLIYYGYLPKELDHINRNKSDNRICNLRECNRSQNNANTLPYKNRKYKGICFDKRCGKYRVQIGYKKENYYLGRFDTPEAAALAYNAKALELYGEFAYLNEVDQSEQLLFEDLK